MRVTPRMLHLSQTRMEKSESYKKYFKKATPDSSKQLKEGSKSVEAKKVGKDLLVEKAGEKITISRLGQNNQKTALMTLSTQTDEGRRMARQMGFSADENTKALNARIKRIHRNNSLAKVW